MADVNARIVVDMETAQAQAQLRALQSQVTALNKTMSAASLQQFAGAQGVIKQTTTSVTRLDNALAGASRSFKDSFRTAGQAIRGQGDAMLLAQRRAQTLNATYTQLGKASGGIQAYNKELSNVAKNTTVAAQRQVILNRALMQGSTAMLNYGKNLQWAGRQMMVGFTVPLTILGGVAAKTFMDMERQIVNFRRVYGDFETTEQDTDRMTEAIKEQALEFAKWGVTVRDSIELAASAAATGLEETDLLQVTEGATRLATLGMITQEQALDTMISLNSAFKIQGQELEDTVNFLNAVENQTVLALADVTEAIPLVAPVIQGLGGDIKDLAVFMTAMREGGIGANEAANALKTSLARLVTPAKAARDRAEELGINLKALVEDNQGDLMGMIMDLARAMESLSDLQKQQLLSDLFGKRQFARMGALFSNIADEASQAQRVIDLTANSTAELAALADKELGAIEESTGMRFTKAMEELKVAIAPVGEAFLKILTPIIEFGTKIANWFNGLSDGAKEFVTYLTVIGGVIIPVGVMLTGIVLNFTSFMIKALAAAQAFFAKVQTGAGSMQYLNQEQMEATLAAEQLSAAENKVTAALNAQAQAVANLGKQYTALAGQRRTGGTPPIKMATGGNVPGAGNTDKIPALLTPGEFVVKKDQANKHRGFLTALNSGMVKGFSEGSARFKTSDIIADSGYRSTPASADKLTKSLEMLYSALQDSTAVEKEVTAKLTEFNARGQSLTEAISSLRAEYQQSISRHGTAKAHVADPVASGKDAAIRLSQESGMGSKQIVADVMGEIVGSSDAAAQGLFEVAGESGKAAISVDALGDAVAMLPNAVNDQLKSGGQMDARNLQISMNEEWRNTNHVGAALGKQMQRMGHSVAEADAAIDLVEKEFYSLVDGLDPQAIVVESKELAQQMGGAERNVYSLNEMFEQAVAKANQTHPQLDGALKELTTEVGSYRVTFSDEAIEVVNGMSDLAYVLRRVGDTIEIFEKNFDGSAGKLLGSFQNRGTTQGGKRKSSAPGATGSVYYGGFATADTSAATAKRRNTRLAEEEAAGKQDAAAYLKGRVAGLEGADPYPEARDRQSPHPQSSIDGDDDADSYLSARRAALEGADPYTDSPIKNGGGLAGSPNKSNQKLAALQNQRAKTTQQAVVADQKVVAASNRQVAAQNRFANITNIASAAMTKVAASAKTFGLALKNGSMKVSGVTGALTGVVFAASMIEGPMQDLAQQIMPATFALMALQQLAPLLMNPIGLMVAAVVGVAAGLWYLNKKTQEAAQAAQDFAINSQGSVKALKDFAEGLGKIDPQAEWAKVVGGVTEDQEESFGKAMEFVKSEAGQSMVERAEGLSGNQRVEALLAEMRLAIATGLIDKDTARSISQALAVELKDPALGQALVTGITDFTSRNNDDAFKQTKAVLEDITVELHEQSKEMRDQEKSQFRLAELKQKQLAGTLEGNELSELAELEYAVQNGEEVAMSLNSVAAASGNLMNTTAKLSQIQASANIAFREGAIDAQEYASISEDVAAKQSQVSKEIATLQNSVSDGLFREQMFNAATAIGMPEEELGKVKTQIEALDKSFADSDLFSGNKEQAKLQQRVSDNLMAGMLSGDIDSGTAGKAVEVLTSGDEKYDVYVEMIEKNPESSSAILKMINSLEMLPPTYRTKFEAEIDVEGAGRNGEPPGQRRKKTTQELIKEAEAYAVASSYFIDDMTLKAQAFDEVMAGTMDTEDVARAEEYYNTIKSKSQDAVSGLDLGELSEISKFFEDNENLEKDTKVTFAATENGKPVTLKSYIKSADISWKKFDALPDINKQIVITAIANLDALYAQFNALKDSGNFSGGELGGLAGEISKGMDAIEEAMAIGENAANTPTGSGSSSGGSEPELNWLQELEKDTKESKELYGKIINAEKEKNGLKQGWVKWLRENSNLTEEAIQELARDEDARKKYYKMSEAERDKVDKKSNNNELRKLKSDTAAKEKKKQEELNVTQREGNTLIAKTIKENEALMRLYDDRGKSDKQAAKDREKAKKIAQDIVNVEMTASEQLKWQNQQIEKQEQLLMKNLQVVKMRSEVMAEAAAEAVVGKSQEAMQEQNVTLQAEADYIRKSQIGPIQDKIEAQQKIIDGIEREAELLERGLEVYDDQLEAKQKQVEEMQRADELMMRESQMLDHDLKLMGYQEEAINKTYEERINALDKVAQLNQQIANQQKDQLGVADALRRGDVSAAAAAAQQMQQNQMQFAADQFRSQLETSRDSQIESLTGAESGMTRDQITDRQRSLEESSYQTSLRIRAVEDEIYNIEQLRAGKQAEIQALLDTTRQYEDAIFELEGDILEIEEGQLKVLEDKIEANERDLAFINWKTLAESEGHRVAIAQETERQAMAKATRDLDVLALEMQESLGQSIEDNIRLMNAFGTSAARANRAIKTGKYTSVGAKNAAMTEVINDYTNRIASVPANITATGTAPTFSVPASAVTSGTVGGIMGNITNNYNNSNVNVMAQGADANQVADIVIQKLEARKNSNIGGL